MSNWDIPEYQELEDFAWDRMEVGDLRGATDAALRAIKLEPDTIDSYVILAQAAAVLGQKQAYAREAVRLGEIEFKDEIASAPSEDFPFWSVTRTRPYMRGLHTLALALWEDGRSGARDEAIEIAQKMFRICPNDNIGVRFLLPEWCARQNRWSLGRRLLSEFRDEYRTEMNMWAALYAFHDHDLDVAQDMVSKARQTNTHIAKRHPDVVDAAAIAIPHPKWDERPLLVCVSAGDKSTSGEEIRSLFSETVPSWQVPDLAFVDQLPIGATGKVLKNELRQRFGDFHADNKGTQ